MIDLNTKVDAVSSHLVQRHKVNTILGYSQNIDQRTYGENLEPYEKYTKLQSN